MNTAEQEYTPKYSNMTFLLKHHGVQMSAVKANKKLVELGILQERQRPSTSDPNVTKTYRVISEKFGWLGVNVRNPACPAETIPHFDLYKFAVIAERLTKNPVVSISRGFL